VIISGERLEDRKSQSGLNHECFAYRLRYRIPLRLIASGLGFGARLIAAKS